MKFSYRRRIVLLIFLLIFPSNYCGKKIHLHNEINVPNTFESAKENQEKQLTNLKIITQTEKNDQHSNENETNGVVSENFVVFTIVCFVIANIQLLLLLGYLNSVSFEKHGMLLYLYMDVVKICLLINGLWLTAVVSCKWFGDGLNLDETAAKPIAYCFLAFGQMLMLTMNVMAILRFRMMKEKMLDPPMPWDSSGEETISSINKVRSFILLLTSLSICILYGFDIYPKTYYSLIGDRRSYLTLPVGTAIISAFQLFLVLAYIIAAVINQFRQNGSHPDDYEEYYPRQLNFLLLGLLVLVIIFLMSSICIPYGHGYLWITLQSVITLGGVIFPGSLIALVAPLRSYVRRKISNVLSIGFEKLKDNTWLGYIYRACRRSSPTIVPIA